MSSLLDPRHRSSACFSVPHTADRMGDAREGGSSGSGSTGRRFVQRREEGGGVSQGGCRCGRHRPQVHSVQIDAAPMRLNVGGGGVSRGACPLRPSRPGNLVLVEIGSGITRKNKLQQRCMSEL